MIADVDRSLAQIERFRVQRCLGRGAAGVVYEVLDQRRNGARLALKALASLGATHILQMKEEFRGLQDVEHPNLLKLIELGCEQGLWFISMELVDGGVPLTRFVRSTPDDFDEARLRSVFAQLARGLGALHEAGKIHRDVKPSNVLVDAGGRTIILDFGLVRDVVLKREDDAIVGTATYMAPEQALLENVGPEADLYSVGVMLYECLTGRCPFEGTMAEVLSAKMHRAPAAPSTLSPRVGPDLDALTMGLLDADPERRPSVRQILSNLEGSEALPTADRGSEKRRVGMFVGRASELTELDEARAIVAGGSAVTVLIEGEGGLGKSALTREFIRRHAGAVLPIFGRCYEREALPYKGVDGVMDAIADHLLSGESGALATPLHGAEHLARSFSAFARVPGFVLDGPAPKDATQARMALFAAVRGLVAALSRQALLVIVIDDWHWSDPDSVALMRDVLRPPHAPPFLFIATVRPVTFERETSPVELPGAVRHLRLERLSDEDSVRLASSLLGAEGSPEAARSMAAEAAGNPLFLDELARDRDRPTRAEGATPLDALILRRVGALAAPSRRLLETLCVGGVSLPLAIAGAAAALTPGDLVVAAATLRTGHLSRGGTLTAAETLEPYHDRIRDAVTGGLTLAAKSALHAALADALTAAKWHDSEAIARHFLGAGDERRAIAPLLSAADRAQAAAAFALAARLYDRALSLTALPEADRPALAAKVAAALSNAGLGRDAALAYDRAATLASRSGAVPLKRRAAEERMFAGEIDAGIAAAKRVLDAVHIRYPESTFIAVSGILWWRLLCLFYAVGWRPRAVAAARLERRGEQLDACTGVAYAISIVDPIRGAYLQALAVLLTLRLGDARRLSAALALNAAFYAAAGAHKARVVESLFTDARRWMAETGNIEPRSFVEGCHGVCTYLLGRFADSAEHCRSANALILQDRPGGYWDQRNVLTARLWALAYMGRFNELAEESERLRREADARGDLAAMTARRLGNINMVWLRAGTSARAREEATNALASWPQKGIHIPLFWSIFAEAQIDLYEDQPEAARRRIDGHWRALRGAFLFQVEITHLEARELRARASLASARRAASNEREALLESARRDTAVVRKSAGAHAKALAHALEGAAHVIRGERSAASTAMRKALAGFELQSMQLHAAAMRRCLAHLDGDDELAAAAARYFETEGVVDPDAMTRLVAPAFDALSTPRAELST